MSFALGISEVPVLRFFWLTVIGAGIGAVAVGVAAYLFGSALDQRLGHYRHYERMLSILVATTGAMVWIVYIYCRNHRQTSRMPV